MSADVGGFVLVGRILFSIFFVRSGCLFGWAGHSLRFAVTGRRHDLVMGGTPSVT
jgi:hypothetical protein